MGVLSGKPGAVVTIDLPKARRLALALVLGQAGITLAVALASLGLGGIREALSALIGGGIGTVATLGMALLAFAGGARAGVQRVTRAFYLGEVFKIAVMIVLFVTVLKWVKVAAGAMFAAYVATFFVYWIALARALPSFGAAAARAQGKE